VGTNGVTAGAITLTGNSIVNGDVATGPGGTVSLGSGTSITGTITHDMAKDVPSVVVPTDLTGLVNQGNYSASGHSTGLLTAGDYKYSQLSISGNATVTISGKVRLYITANPSLSISGNGMLIVAPGAELEIYTAGSCSISGNGIANQTNVPKNLLLFSTYTGNNGMSFSGNADLYGVLYAPDTNVACSGNASLYGSMVGNTVSLTGNAELHYDEALTDVSTGFFPCTYIIQSWREQ
jgi:hypothetical protein